MQRTKINKAARTFLSELCNEGVLRKVGTSGRSVRYKSADAELTDG